LEILPNLAGKVIVEIVQWSFVNKTIRGINKMWSK